MEDKYFLGYFHELSSQDLVAKKQAAYKIVETLTVTDALGKTKSYEHLDAKVLKMLQKYMSGDLGAKVSTDLNYALKK